MDVLVALPAIRTGKKRREWRESYASSPRIVPDLRKRLYE